MFSFVLKKLGYALLVMLGVVILVFYLFQVLPDPSQLTRGQSSDSTTNANIRLELGLDLNTTDRLFLYLNDLSPISIHKPTEANKIKYNYHVLFHIDTKAWVIKTPYLRRSYQNQKNVSSILQEAFIGTIVLAFSALIIAFLLGVLMGVIAALKKDSGYDRAILLVSNLGISIPSFLLAIIISWVFGLVWHRYTHLNMTGSLYDYDVLYGKVMAWPNLILPALALGIRPLSIITQLTRSSMLDVLSQDYIRTAKAKGLGTTQIIMKHALRNALNPVITATGGWFASMLAGAFFIEYIFNWKGLGRVTVDALEKSDFPVIMGSVLIIAAIFITVSILVDLLYAVLDPRIRLD
ncbi:MAG: ABC transporter permease [Bacteroidetes bacterium]|nr:ABC transporter permease [Bacteroidota bacterium]